MQYTGEIVLTVNVTVLNNSPARSRAPDTTHRTGKYCIAAIVVGVCFGFLACLSLRDGLPQVNKLVKFNGHLLRVDSLA